MQVKDLQIGQNLNVYGRRVILTDCDEFTRNFYSLKYGIEEFNPIAIPTRSQKYYEYRKKKQDQELPPFNGWGTHEDSESNCKGIELKPPHIDFSKFINYDKYEMMVDCAVNLQGFTFYSCSLDSYFI